MNVRPTPITVIPMPHVRTERHPIMVVRNSLVLATTAITVTVLLVPRGELALQVSMLAPMEPQRLIDNVQIVQEVLTKVLAVTRAATLRVDLVRAGILRGAVLRVATILTNVHLVRRVARTQIVAIRREATVAHVNPVIGRVMVGIVGHGALVVLGNT